MKLNILTYSTLAFIGLLLITCKSNNDGLKKYQLDCPKILAENEYTHFSNKFSLNIPYSWTVASNEVVDSNFVNVIFTPDTSSDIDLNEKFIRLHMVGIISYKGKSNNLKIENELSLQDFKQDFNSAIILSNGFTDVFGYDSYFIEYEEDNEYGRTRSMSFLIQSKITKLEYYVINSTSIGQYDANFELCQHFEILKSFKLL